MKKNKFFITLFIVAIVAASYFEFNYDKSQEKIWTTDFYDDFDSFNSDNWQDQRIWVNNESQCYVPDGNYGTREVSNGTLKLKVVNIGSDYDCDNLDKFGVKHPNTTYVAGRIASKNKQEFIKGKWTARLRVVGGSQKSMFPA